MLPRIQIGGPGPVLAPMELDSLLNIKEGTRADIVAAAFAISTLSPSLSDSIEF